MNPREHLRDLVEASNAYLFDGEETAWLEALQRAEAALEMPDDQASKDLLELLEMYPELGESDARMFLAQVGESGLSWRMGDIVPIVYENDETRSVRAYERHRVIVDAFDQWCKALDARWSMDEYWIVVDGDMRAEYQCDAGDTLICVKLRDTVLRMQYAREFDLFSKAAQRLGIPGGEAYKTWLAHAGEPPQDTITRGYGVWRAKIETIDSRYGKTAAWMARKRAERDAIQRRAPHIISLRHRVSVDQEVIELMQVKEDLTPEQLADRYVQNARKLGRRSINDTLV